MTTRFTHRIQPSKAQSSLQGATVLAAAFAFHIVMALGFGSYIGPQIYAMAVFPVFAAAWFFEVHGGIAAGLFCFLINACLRMAMGMAVVPALVQSLPALLICPVFGAGIGYIRLTQRLLAKELRSRQIAESTLHSAQERYQQLFNSSRDGIFFMNSDGKIVDANPAFLQLTGYSASECYGECYNDKLPLLNTLKNVLSSTLLNPEFAEDFEKEIKQGDGTSLWVNIRIWAFQTLPGSNSKMGLLGIARNITERKQTMDRLRDTQEQLMQSQKLESIGQLAGGISHDFNNLLAVILGSATILKSEFGDNAEISRRLDNIIQSAERGASVTRQLLGFARKGSYTVDQIDAPNLIQEVMGMLSRSIEKTVTLHLKTPESLWQIKGDATQIVQTLMNLSLNARDAMPGGGKIIFTTSNVDVNSQTSGSETGLKPGKYVRIDVRDTGSGIPKEIQSRIFDPFFTTKEMGKGTGLGLSMVYGIMQTHNGLVTLDSEVGQGTTFHLYFPAIKTNSETTDMNAARSPSRLEPTGLLKKLCILLAEDESPLRAMIQEELEQQGARVLAAENGKKALQLFEEQGDRIDAVLLDVGMPEMSGTEVFRRIRLHNPHMSVILMTGYADSAEISQLMQTPGTALLRKPFDMNDLIKLLSATQAPEKSKAA